MEEGVKLNLRQKLAAMMGEVGYIEKRGRNESQNYDYVQAADVTAIVAKLCHKYGLAFWPCEEDLEWETRATSKGTAMFVCRAHMKYTFADTETNEQIVVPSTGEGMDVGDKAVFKAKTGALKYALIQTLLIATGDDPEVEREDEKTEDQIKPKVVVEGPKMADPKPKPAYAAKTCPDCGQVGTIIKGRAEFGGGFVCYKVKGGCGAKFRDDDIRITGSGEHNRGFPWEPNGSVGDKPKDESGANGPVQGNARETISAERVAELESLCERYRVSPTALISQYRTADKAVRTLNDLTQAQYDHAKGVFEIRRKMQEEQ